MINIDIKTGIKNFNSFKFPLIMSNIFYSENVKGIIDWVKIERYPNGDITFYINLYDKTYYLKKDNVNTTKHGQYIVTRDRARVVWKILKDHGWCL